MVTCGEGFELKGVLSDQGRARWLLKGREIYVLASHPRASGFVSTTRLALGRSHVVLCVENLVAASRSDSERGGMRGIYKIGRNAWYAIWLGWISRAYRRQKR